ncbi:MAG TPA: dihydroorotate dehydrogenase electron transfer subunit [Acidobacteriota bacterium]|nr:dihydroorotate dehydrogenase electron transfer subunit [Acidobacteriota bacterium]
MTRLACQDTFLIKHRDLKNNYHSLTLGPYGPAARCRPGSFVHLRLPCPEVYFRRAMSVADVDPSRREIEIIFKVVGRGTAILAGYRKRASIDVLGPLGNSFRFPGKDEAALLVAGGVGFPPLLYLAAEMVRRGRDPKRIAFFYGGRTRGDVVERSRIRRLGVRFYPVTEDGSLGRRGLVTDAVQEYIGAHAGEKMRLYGCGPEGMLKATDDLGLRYRLAGQLSLEAPMPCGFGVCLGCVVPLRAGGHARVCCEGPVFNIGEVLL